MPNVTVQCSADLSRYLRCDDWYLPILVIIEITEENQRIINQINCKYSLTEHSIREKVFNERVVTAMSASISITRLPPYTNDTKTCTDCESKKKNKALKRLQEQIK